MLSNKPLQPIAAKTRLRLNGSVSHQGTKMSDDGYWSLVEPIWLSLNQSWDRGAKEFIRQFSSMRSDAKHLYAAHWCMSEVDNGGLFQFFSNTTGILAPEAEAGFRAIGLAQLSQLLSEAMRYFGEPYPRDRSERLASLPASQRGERDKWNPFHKLDNSFYDCSSQWQAAADAFALRIKHTHRMANKFMKSIRSAHPTSKSLRALPAACESRYPL
jgi:Domain of unknown function (DUF4375)